MNLREEKGYTYGAYTRIDTKRLAGDFEATAEVRTPVTGDSLREFFYELNRIKDEKVSAEELQDAKAYLTGVFPIRGRNAGRFDFAYRFSKTLHFTRRLPANYREKSTRSLPKKSSRSPINI